ncbi:hypothetical protein [Halovivax sp.]|uniref:hypothetical protein n=1 Tax=Halovivax sp. TaxID=1935978 RepID=UPI0025BE3C16|nr:hypothetical protein [Halovivax sp.]
MVEVSYYCPHCGAITVLERPARLADKSVTARKQPGWEYAAPDDSDRESADGIALRCGEDGEPTNRDGETVDGCGRPFYLNFVRFRRGVELEPDPPAEGGPRFDFRR